jgi:hypothetical protein
VGSGRAEWAGSDAGASRHPHIRPRFGLDMGVPVSPGIWAGYGEAGWVAFLRLDTGWAARSGV